MFEQNNFVFNNNNIYRNKAKDQQWVHICQARSRTIPPRNR